MMNGFSFIPKGRQGAFEVATGRGPGTGNRADMAKVIVGGQALSLLLSLLVTPVSYSLFDDLALRFRRKSGAKRLESAPEDAAVMHYRPRSA